MAARVPDMCCNFYLVKNHKIDKNSTTTKAREKRRTDLGFLQFKKFSDGCLTNLKAIKFYQIKLASDFYLQPSDLLGERASL